MDETAWTAPEDVAFLQIGIDYAEFCLNPQASLEFIASRYQEVGVELAPMKPLPQVLSSGDSVRLPAEDLERLLAAYAKFSGESLTLPASARA